MKRIEEVLREIDMTPYRDVIVKLMGTEDIGLIDKVSEKLAEEDIEEIAEKFISQLLELEEAKRLLEEKFRNSEELESLKNRIREGIYVLLKEHKNIKRYLDLLKRISQAHFSVGVEPKVFLLAYSIYQDIVFGKVEELTNTDLTLANSLLKKALFEITVILDNYWKYILERLFFVEQRTLIDSLTQVYNRRFLEVELPKKLKMDMIPRYSIVMIDLDDFKMINDTYGHLIGDAYLREFARFLIRSFKGKDFIVRYGGDEFIIVLTDVGKRLASKLMRRLALDNRILLLPNNQKFPLRFSWGVAEYPIDSQDLMELIRKADKRMYAQKRRKKRRDER